MTITSTWSAHRSGIWEYRRDVGVELHDVLADAYPSA
jgi:hypothetical protein